MRIGIDARELTGRPTGVGRYLVELLTEWAGDPDAARHTFTLYTHATPAWLPEAFRSSVRIVPGAGGTRWEQRDLARAIAADRPGVFFAPGYTAPLTAAAPVVVAVHDVSFFAHPEWFGWREGLRRRHLTAWSARRARRVITISEFSRREIVAHIGLPEARIQVIYPGIRPPASPATAARDPLVLYVGSLFQRRHVDALITAFAQVRAGVPGARLEIVGENRTRPHIDFDALVARLGLGEAVSLRSYVDEATLGDLYDRAAVFVFLSAYEGFGLTPLEALAAGAAPVVLDTPVAREVLGPAARFVPPVAAVHGVIADALTDLLTDVPGRAALLAHAGDVLGRYQWRDAARATLHVLEEAAGV
ncbi:MAG: glycosyltransferase family 1 protein [Vicinamibacterales bacterium]|nr:glycosyltransferase family 1 protein [Vicinamibacterales bacterium]